MSLAKAIRYAKKRAAFVTPLVQKYSRRTVDIAPASFTIQWTPNDGPQRLAYESEADELYYGGAAGGGKSDLLLGLALTRHANSVIFRREYPQLTAIVDRSRELIGSLGTWSGKFNRWKLPMKRQLEFGACQHEKDVDKWQGRPHDFVGIDELPHITLSQYLFLTGWNRTTIPGQRCRVVGGGNPPLNAEGEWVMERWAAWLDPDHPNPAKPGELRWYVMIEGRDTEVEVGEPFEHTHSETGKVETLYPKSRTFLPAFLSDNPYQAGTGYEGIIDRFPEPIRSALKHGDFGFKRPDDAFQVIPTEWIDLAMKRWDASCKFGRKMTGAGLDISRGGAAETVLARRYGVFIDQLDTWQGESTNDGPKVAQLVIPLIEKDAIVALDAIGIGSSAYDSMKGSVKCEPVNFADATNETDRNDVVGFRNIRALVYWRLREALDPETGIGLMLPPDKELRKQLRAIRWKLSISGIQIEEKKKIEKDVGSSIDRADAVAYAMYDPGTIESDKDIYKQLMGR